MNDKTLKEKLLSRRNPRHYPCKLSTEQAREIVERYASGETGVSLAEEFGVSAATVWYHVRKAIAE